mgnify:CR=1 FL=1
MGGGVAGLSAAHELVERGYEVVVLEMRDIAGGKARSFGMPGSGTLGRPDLPAEHGFRFFPGFYRHLPDTMRRIPYGSGNVEDNLVPASSLMLAQTGGAENFLSVKFPSTLLRSREQIEALFGATGGLSDDDIQFFVNRLWVLATSCDARRFDEFEKRSWWDFIGAGTRGAAYQRLLGRGLTQTLVAMQAERGSTRTVGIILLQLLLDLVEPGRNLDDWFRGRFGADRLLNGPTNDVWLDPWVAHLKNKGAEFRFGSAVTQIHLAGGAVTKVTVDDGSTYDLGGDHFMLCLPAERAAPLLHAGIIAADPTLAGVETLAAHHTEWMNGFIYYLHEDLNLVHGHTIYLDSAWALTSLEQAQFWSRPMSGFGDGTIRSVLSVDVSDWNTPGSAAITGSKPARACTGAELVDEVWFQLSEHLNDGPSPVLPQTFAAAYVDPAIVWDPALGANANAEPLLVNERDTWRYRPRATTAIGNLTLAADYVRTHTDLATMEGANEAARRAVNAILRADGKLGRCCVWPLQEPLSLRPFKAKDAVRYALGLKHAADP